MSSSERFFSQNDDYNKGVGTYALLSQQKQIFVTTLS